MLVKKRDPFTGQWNEVELDITQAQIDDWQSGTLIPNAMPNLSPDEREFLITGIKPGTWDDHVK